MSCGSGPSYCSFTSWLLRIGCTCSAPCTVPTALSNCASLLGGAAGALVRPNSFAKLKPDCASGFGANAATPSLFTTRSASGRDFRISYCVW